MSGRSTRSLWEKPCSRCIPRSPAPYSPETVRATCYLQKYRGLIVEVVDVCLGLDGVGEGGACGFPLIEGFHADGGDEAEDRGRWGIHPRCVGFDCRMGDTVPFCEAGWLPNERTRGSDLTALGVLAIGFENPTSRIRFFKSLLPHG